MTKTPSRGEAAWKQRTKKRRHGSTRSIHHPFQPPSSSYSQPSTSTPACLLLRVQAQDSGMDVRLRTLQLLPPHFMLQNAPSNQPPRGPVPPHPHPHSHPSLPSRCLQMRCLWQARQRLLLPLRFMQPRSPYHLRVHAVDSNSPLPPSPPQPHFLPSLHQPEFLLRYLPELGLQPVALPLPLL